VGPDGSIEDPQRIAYLRRHLQKLHQAIEAGVPVRGYFVWSLLDNFKWADGTAQSVGLVYVDYASLRRTPKASAEWYRQAIRRNAVDSTECPD
jgi:beta-glucosidase